MERLQDPEQDNPAAKDREPTVENLDSGLPPVVLRWTTDDKVRASDFFQIAHEESGKWSLQDACGRDFWVEQDGRRAFLPSHKDSLASLASCQSPVLITGAKGTGKEELARFILSHAQNPRREARFEVVDCDAMQPADVGVDLFGRGGASGRSGKLVGCKGGTVLVKNVDLLSPEWRARLIRFLQYGDVRPIDSDLTEKGVDVRLFATTRLGMDGNTLLKGDLAKFFPKEERLPALKDERRAIPILLAEFLRPFDAVRDVHVNWLLRLLCHDWPGNIGELKGYCKRAKERATAMRCPVLCEALGPVNASGDDATQRIEPRQVANSLLALREKEFQKAADSSCETEVPDEPDKLANSLRLLVQLCDERQDDFREPRRGWANLRCYAHPDRIPLALFFEGCRCPPCYEVEVVVPARRSPANGILPSSCIDDFIRHVSYIVSDTSILTEDKRFRAAFGTGLGVIATLKPSPGFSHWVTSLRASLPKYEEFRAHITVPPVGVLGREASGRLADPEPTDEECRHAKVEVDRLLVARGKSNPLVGESPAMLRLYPDILQVAQESDNHINVFIYGEYGSGKEVLTDLLAFFNKDPDKEAVRFDVSAHDEDLASSEFFGVAKNAATGVDEREGLIQLAGRGTLMCDGLEAASSEFLARLKRVLSERQYQRVGSPVTKTAECRFICCSNIHLSVLLQEKRAFHNFPSRWGVQFELPSLDDRKEDIPNLVRAAISRKLKGRHLDDLLLDRLYPPHDRIDLWMGSRWSGAVGNVRGLFNEVKSYLRQENIRTILHAQDGTPSPVARPVNPTGPSPSRAGDAGASRIRQRNPPHRNKSLIDERIVEILQWADEEKRSCRFNENMLWSKFRDEAGRDVYGNHKALSERVRRIRDPELKRRAKEFVGYIFDTIA